MPRRLGVNIDHVATVRQARRSPYPDPVAAALLAELSGADQITCHIRCDRRHIQDEDLERLRDAVQTELNVELAVTEEMRGVALSIRPHRITLVPERPEEITTEGGLDVVAHLSEIESFVRELKEAGIRVSLFVDPDPKQIDACVLEGVDMIELNTARYAEEGGVAEIARLKSAAQRAETVGLEVAAGHGLTHHNLALLVENVPEIVEYNIGHSIVSRAIFVGLDQAVRDLCDIIRSRD